MNCTYLRCSQVSIPCLGFILIVRRECSISFTSFSVCDISNNTISQQIMNNYKPPFFAQSNKKAGPLASLKKFCESLPCSETKPSGLNMIVWQKRLYSPNEKERRLKVENDIVKQQIAHESSKQRRNHIRSRSCTESDSQHGTYKQHYARIEKKELSTSLITKQQQQVFGNMKNEASVRAEFKRNHKEVWSFILSKRKTAGPCEGTPIRQKLITNQEIEGRKQRKREFNQKLNNYLRKWKPQESRQLLSNSKSEASSKLGGSSLSTRFGTMMLAKSGVEERG